MLLATGITLIFGVMKVVNFAHGELMMLGAFVTFILAHSAGLSPYTGTLPSIKAFAVIILGGLGSVRGAVIGGLLYGCIESAATFFLGGSWRDATAFVLLILVLVTRPQGLFREGT